MSSLGGLSSVVAAVHACSHVQPCSMKTCKKHLQHHNPACMQSRGVSPCMRRKSRLLVKGNPTYQDSYLGTEVAQPHRDRSGLLGHTQGGPTRLHWYPGRIEAENIDRRIQTAYQKSFPKTKDIAKCNKSYSF